MKYVELHLHLLSALNAHPIALSHIIYYVCLQVFKQFQKTLSLKEGDTCTRVFSTSKGLPCSHNLKWLLNQWINLQLDHLHQHWRLEQPVKLIPQPQVAVGFDDILKNLHEQHANSALHHQRLLEQLHDIVTGLMSSVQDPAPICRQPQGSTANYNPSMFEYMESQSASSLKHKCGTCQGNGHNKRTCPWQNLAITVGSSGVDGDTATNA